MFGRREKSIEAIEGYTKDELKEYVSVDTIKAHLVNMLDENRELKKELEGLRERSSKDIRKAEEKEQLSLVAADEYKKRQREAERKAEELKKELSQVKEEQERLKEKYNNSRILAETAEKRVADIRAQQEIEAVAGRSILEFARENPDLRKLRKETLVKAIEEAIDYSC